MLSVGLTAAASLLRVGSGHRAEYRLPPGYEAPVAALVDFTQRERQLCFTTLPKIEVVVGRGKWAEVYNDPGSHRSAGFYVVETNRVFVRAGEPARVESVMVHELVHALQFQSFPALRSPASSPENAAARHALIEADADIVMDSYLRLLVDSGHPAADRIRESLTSMSEAQAFAEWIKRERGQEALDVVLISPDLEPRDFDDPDGFLRRAVPSSGRAPVPQPAEGRGLNPLQCGFDSHRGHSGCCQGPVDFDDPVHGDRMSEPLQ